MDEEAGRTGSTQRQRGWVMSERIRKRYEWELHHIRMGEPISTLPKHLISDIGELLDRIAELERRIEAVDGLPEKWRRLDLNQHDLHGVTMTFSGKLDGAQCADELQATLNKDSGVSDD